MQCVNCQFENLPGVTTCGRCQSSLVLATICVTPIRASRLGLQTRMRRLFYRCESAIRQAIPWIPKDFIDAISSPHWTAAALSIVPGLGHFVFGQRRLGAILLGLWLLLLMLALLAFPYGSALYIFSFAIAVHSFAVISHFSRSLSAMRIAIRCVFGMMAYMVLYMYVYAPTASLAANYVSGITLPSLPSNPLLQTGDGILFEGPWMRQETFNRGDLVVYQINEHQLSGHNYTHAGMGIDRVIGVPGDTVSVQGGVLLVNGVEPPEPARPIALMPMADFSFYVPNGHLAIVPSLARLYEHQTTMSKEMATTMVDVQLSDVYGRVLYRVKPWSRLGAVR